MLHSDWEEEMAKIMSGGGKCLRHHLGLLALLIMI